MAGESRFRARVSEGPRNSIPGATSANKRRSFYRTRDVHRYNNNVLFAGRL